MTSAGAKMRDVILKKNLKAPLQVFIGKKTKNNVTKIKI
jgi:hypothetical protein